MKNKSVSLVFWVSLVICTIFVAFGAIFPKQLEKLTQNITTFIALHFSWYYLLLVLVILFVCVYILFSRYANITLGEEGEDPEFSLPSWFAMLFSAGMGIGLVFWTTAEPISHAFKLTPIHKAGTQSAINDAMQFSFFHWGIHAWAVYGIVALVFAYFSFHKGYPGLVSATLTPLLGEKAMRGPLGGAIDVLAVIATVTGVAATLGFGALQINEGLHFLFNVPSNFTMQVILIVIATILFTWSAWSGIDKGIKTLSNINMLLAFVVLIGLFIVGPTLYILNTFTNGLGNYIANFFKAQINQKLSEPETKKIYSQRKIDVEPVFGFMKAILGFTRMSVRGINKVKRELGFVLMALNIRKIVARRAVYYQIHLKKADFYQIINRNQLFYIA
ncbi:Glycine betaine transporter OpuD [Staphylococcus aureus]|nr:Glycine betaine transporter OpuD [Staphylococcus aureus]